MTGAMDYVEYTRLAGWVAQYGVGVPGWMYYQEAAHAAGLDLTNRRHMDCYTALSKLMDGCIFGPYLMELTGKGGSRWNGWEV